MTDNRVDTALAEAVARVAPEVDLAAIDPAKNFREQADIDSMDFLRIVQELHTLLGVDVPEVDYRRLDTLDGARRYLTERLAG